MGEIRAHFFYFQKRARETSPLSPARCAPDQENGAIIFYMKCSFYDLFISLFVYLFIYLSIYLFIYLLIYFIYLFIHLFIYFHFCFNKELIIL